MLIHMLLSMRLSMRIRYIISIRYKNGRSMVLHKLPNKKIFLRKEIVLDDRVTHIYENFFHTILYYIILIKKIKKIIKLLRSAAERKINITKEGGSGTRRKDLKAQ